MEPREQIEFLVTFANADFQNIREGDLINLQDDFERFFKQTIQEMNTLPVVHYGLPATGKRCPPDTLQAIQPELRVILRNALLPPFTGLIEGKSILKPRKIEIQQMLIPGGFLSYTGEPDDLFFFKLGHLLQDRGAVSNLRRCPACEKFFAKVRRQKFCSRTCTLHTNKKDWLDAQRRAKEAKRSKGKGRRKS